MELVPAKNIDRITTGPAFYVRSARSRRKGIDKSFWQELIVLSAIGYFFIRFLGWLIS